MKLGQHEFPDKHAARLYIRQILQETDYESFILPDSDNGLVLTDLLLQHPRAAEKIGSGISYFSTVRG